MPITKYDMSCFYSFIVRIVTILRGEATDECYLICINCKIQIFIETNDCTWVNYSQDKEVSQCDWNSKYYV